jgi:hypothetical protein
MNKPSLGTRILGHPLIGLPILGLGAFVLYQCTQDTSNWPLGLGAMGAISATMRASEKAEAYRTWKLAWDSMSDAPPRSGRMGRVFRGLVGLALFGALILFLIGNSDKPEYGIALGWVLLVGGFGVVARLALRLWRSRARAPKAATAKPVAIAIVRPLYAVPDMRQCYRNLPKHCQALLHARPSDAAH